jgi:hypothetical protein
MSAASLLIMRWLDPRNYAAAMQARSAATAVTPTTVAAVKTSRNADYSLFPLFSV